MGGEGTPGQPGESLTSVLNEVDRQQIAAWLGAGHYHRAAALLKEKQVALDEDTVLASTLAAACQLCLVCDEYQAEVAAHEQAGADAAEREHELRRRIRSILSLAAGQDIQGQEAVGKRRSPASSGLLQRVARLFGHESEETVPSDAAPTMPTGAIPSPASSSHARRVYRRRPRSRRLKELAAAVETGVSLIQESETPPPRLVYRRRARSYRLQELHEQVETDVLFPSQSESRDRRLVYRQRPRSRRLRELGAQVESGEAVATQSEVPEPQLVYRRRPRSRRLAELGVPVERDTATPTEFEAPAPKLVYRRRPRSRRLQELGAGVERDVVTRAEPETISPTPVYRQRPRGRLLRRWRTPAQRVEAEAETPAPRRLAELLSAEQPPSSPANPADEEGPSLVVYCLGPFSVYQNEAAITEWNGLKGLAILKYMVAQEGRPVAKEVLMDVVWPDADPQAARRNLHQAIYSLRQTLRRGDPDFQHIQFHNESYRFNPRLHLWCDFVEFENYVNSGLRLEAEDKIDEAIEVYGVAEGMYGGDFFEDDLFEDWPVGRRERLRSLYLKIVDRLVDYYMRRGEYTTVVALCHRALAQDPYYESAHRQLMKCHLAQGQRHLAVRQYQTCARLLEEELDLEPSAETQAVYQRVVSR